MTAFTIDANARLARFRPTALALMPAEESDRRFRHAVTATWCLLFLNTLPFTAGQSILHLPSIVGKGITQAALMIATFAFCSARIGSALRVMPV